MDVLSIIVIEENNFGGKKNIFGRRENNFVGNTIVLADSDNSFLNY